MADFCHFCSCKGVCGGRASDQGRAKKKKCSMPPHVTTAFFFPEKHQTLHDLSLANCMHDNDMIIVDS